MVLKPCSTARAVDKARKPNRVIRLRKLVDVWVCCRIALILNCPSFKFLSEPTARLMIDSTGNHQEYKLMSELDFPMIEVSEVSVRHRSFRFIYAT